METWIKLPAKWILNEEDTSYLKGLRWKGSDKAQNTASLMVLLAIASNVSHRQTYKNPEIGKTQLSYTDLMSITLLSRGIVAGAIQKLISSGLIEKITDGKVNQYIICNFGEDSGWAKLPAKKLYDTKIEIIKAFKHFKLRSRVELNALKIYFLTVALRNRDTNHAQMTYATITKYTAINQNDISPAISLLVSSELIRVLQIESAHHEKAVSNAYRLVGLDTYNHAGTKGKFDPDALTLEAVSEIKN